MTPKEKAEDLVNRYRMILMNEDTECGNEILCSLIAMKNAIICVKEIVEMQKNVNITFQYNIDYWNEVILEVNYPPTPVAMGWASDFTDS